MTKPKSMIEWDEHTSETPQRKKMLKSINCSTQNHFHQAPLISTLILSRSPDFLSTVNTVSSEMYANTNSSDTVPSTIEVDEVDPVN